MPIAQAIFLPNANLAPGQNNGSTIVAASSYTVLPSDTEIIVNNGSTCTLTLPAAASARGRVISVRTCQAFSVISASSNVSVNQGSNATAILAGTAGRWAELRSDGSRWVIIRNNP